MAVEKWRTRTSLEDPLGDEWGYPLPLPFDLNVSMVKRSKLLQPAIQKWTHLSDI